MTKLIDILILLIILFIVSIFIAKALRSTKCYYANMLIYWYIISLT